MAYCVNCGVELAKSEHCCPLCMTKVVNPREPERRPERGPYPKRVELLNLRIDRRYGAALATLILLIPVAICLIVDMGTDGNFSWSRFVVGAAIMFFTSCMLPLMLKKHNLVLYFLLNLTVGILYLYMIYDLTGGGWFLPLATPILVLTNGFVGIILALSRRKKLKGLQVVAAVFLAVGVFTLCVDMLVNNFLGNPIFPWWSLFSFVPCAVLAVFFTVLEKKKDVKEQIRKRLFL